MSYLLDTHAFLWFISDDSALSSTAKALIEDTDNTIWLSVASVWEMAIKISLGKLEMPSPFRDFIDEQLHENSITLLGITIAHADAVVSLPFHHRDPFDRLIVAQSKTEDIPIIGQDVMFDRYEIYRYW